MFTSLKSIRLIIGVALITALVLGGLAACQSEVPTETTPTTPTIPSTPARTTPPSGQARTFTAINATVPADCEPADAGFKEGLNLTSFNTQNFAGSGNCDVCHQTLSDSRGNSVSITSDWRATMMANASKDPLWQAKLSSEVNRNPAISAVIDDKCASCHMPMAKTQAAALELPAGIIDGPFTDPDEELHEAAMDGVSCTLCHQIRDDNLGEADSFSGGYPLDLNTLSPDRLIYGPFPNPVAGQMRNNTGFVPVMGPQTLDSGLCATCHTLYTPYIDAAGNIAGTFPEQTPYLEWEASDFGDGVGEDLICQDCHMPPANGAVVISTMPGRLAAREPFAKHYFVGGNSFVLGMLKDNSSELSVSADSREFEATLSRVTEQLAENTATISLESVEQRDDALALNVSVTNQAGHKLPTGFPSRRTWIHITVTDDTGKVIFESGAPNPDGSIQGNDGDLNPQRFEPHYDLIDSPDQVQLYETVMLNTDGKLTHTLLRAASYAKDNRLLPIGFNKDNVSPDIAVYGAAAVDADFNGGGDRITYLVPISANDAGLEVKLELLYRTTSYPFLADLTADGTPEVTRFTGYLETACRIPKALSYAAYKIQ